MSEKWYVCAAEEWLECCVDYLRATHASSLVIAEDDPVRLRRRLRREAPGRTSALVAEPAADVSAINIAASLIADGHVAEVILAVEVPSGSLRSRAAQAGIEQVLALEDMEAAPRVSARAQHVRSTAEPQVEDVDAPELQGELEPSQAAMNAPEGAAAEAAEAAGEEPDGLSEVQMGCSVLCVASGRGGVGKTSLAACMALDAARWGLKVALVDLDLGSGNLYTYFGLGQVQDLGSLASLDALAPADVARVRTVVQEGLELWGPAAQPEMAETLDWRITRLLELISQTHDLVIVDTSTLVSDAVAQAVQAADRLLLVADERQAAIGSLSRTAALCVRLGLARTRIIRVMNHCSSLKTNDQIDYACQMGLEGARSLRVLEGEDEVAELLAGGRAADLADSDNDFAESAAALIATILSELGILPECAEAERALKRTSRRRRGFFGRMKEAS